MNDLERTVAVSANGAEATILGTTVKCPVCQTENAPSEKYCGECGFLLTSTPGEEAPEFEAADQPKLVDSAGREYFLHEGENTVGRESADILLSDPSVSRKHAVITLEGGKVWVMDLGSTNGTYAAGVQIQPSDKVELRDADELKFGSAIVTLKLPETEDSPPPEGGAGGGVETQETPVAEFELAEEVEPEPATAPVARLVGESGEFQVMPGVNTIGRRSENNIVLGDSFVSGSHAEIAADDDGFRLTDLGSTNGTLLNAIKLEPQATMTLNDGDEIVFGQTTLTFQVEHGTAD